MSDSVETKIALLQSDVEGQKDWLRTVDKSLEKISAVADDMKTMLATHDSRLTNVEMVMKNTSMNNTKTDETLQGLKESLMQLKIDNHVERETNHRELMAAITSSHTKFGEEFDRKIKDVTTKVDGEISDLKARILALQQFKWTTLGMGSMLTVEMILRIFGITA